MLDNFMIIGFPDKSFLGIGGSIFYIETRESLNFLGVVHPIKYPKLKLRLISGEPVAGGYRYMARMEHPEPHAYYPTEVMKLPFTTTDQGGSGCTKCYSTPCKCYHGDKPMYILRRGICYKWNGEKWEGVNNTAFSVSGNASVKELQAAGFTFPTEDEVLNSFYVELKKPLESISKAHDKYQKEQASESVELTLRRLEALPLWREEDLVPPIIKW